MHPCNKIKLLLTRLDPIAKNFVFQIDINPPEAPTEGENSNLQSREFPITNMRNLSSTCGSFVSWMKVAQGISIRTPSVGRPRPLVGSGLSWICDTGSILVVFCSKSLKPLPPHARSLHVGTSVQLIQVRSFSNSDMITLIQQTVPLTEMEIDGGIADIELTPIRTQAVSNLDLESVSPSILITVPHKLARFLNRQSDQMENGTPMKLIQTFNFFLRSKDCSWSKSVNQNSNKVFL
ncbi:hypothetical protein V6N13_007945 [Hibiscus sabdariffa]